MGEIKNELSWSKSRVSMLRSCKRQYYHRYYTFWGGWSYKATESSRLAYRFSKMQRLPTLCGIAVHSTIEAMLFDILETGSIQHDNPAFYARKEILTKTWREAEQELWRRNPKKHPPLFELYYGPRPSAEALKEVGHKSTTCIHNFLNSEIFKDLCASAPQDWLAIEQPLNQDPYSQKSQNLTIDGKTVWVLPDFARRKGDVIELWDWKTGRPNQSDEEQLFAYALFAREFWDAKAEDIKLFNLYLNGEEGAEVVERVCTEEALNKTEATIRSDLTRMTTMLADPETNTPFPMESHFPMTNNLNTCARCEFKEFCAR